MGKATLARQRANGLLGQGRIDKLYDEGKLCVLFQDDYERLKERVAELERRVRLLRDVTVGQADDIAAKVLKEAITDRV